VTIVVKIGTSSLTDDAGQIDRFAVTKLCDEVATAHGAGRRIVVVTSGAIAAGLPALEMADRRPTDSPTLQAISAVGQTRLMRVYNDALEQRGLVGGQVLLAPLDFTIRQQYLHARQTLTRLLDLGVVPIVNENDAIADDEIRFGDNDRLAALVAHLVGASLLLLLTDTAGLLSADPRLDPSASLISEIVEIDHELERLAGGSGSIGGSGGMASKIAAAKMASWSGVRTIIASAARENVVADAIAGRPGVGTVVNPHDRRLPARKLWIAFATGSHGLVTVDGGARAALMELGRSLLAAGVTGVEGVFDAGDAVEVAGPDGSVFAKGIVTVDAATLASIAGGHSTQRPDAGPPEVIHRDDLVMVP